MGQQINAPKGTNDILPEQIPIWEKIESMAKDICRKFGFHQIRTPEFEQTSLFVRGVGGTTDIVQKEMYTFTDRGDRSLTLRPEATAGVMRAYIEGARHSLEPISRQSRIT